MGVDLITAGESHGPGLTCIVQGLPAGLELAREAIELGQLNPDTDPAQLAFELKALLVAANNAFILLDDPTAFARARHAINARLQTPTPSLAVEAPI